MELFRVSRVFTPFANSAAKGRFMLKQGKRTSFFGDPFAAPAAAVLLPVTVLEELSTTPLPSPLASPPLPPSIEEKGPPLSSEVGATTSTQARRRWLPLSPLPLPLLVRLLGWCAPASSVLPTRTRTRLPLCTAHPGSTALEWKNKRSGLRLRASLTKPNRFSASKLTTVASSKYRLRSTKPSSLLLSSFPFTPRDNSGGGLLFPFAAAATVAFGASTITPTGALHAFACAKRARALCHTPRVSPSGQCAAITPSLATRSQFPNFPSLASSKKSMSPNSTPVSRRSALKCCSFDPITICLCGSNSSSVTFLVLLLATSPPPPSPPSPLLSVTPLPVLEEEEEEAPPTTLTLNCPSSFLAHASLFVRDATASCVADQRPPPPPRRLISVASSVRIASASLNKRTSFPAMGPGPLASAYPFRDRSL
mmetsp:Transcript_40421/g.79658  ORF Transcript_40421/g.79658 Transcript_40421/m.79658 type:complete len:424 (-) Transcript_40421:231-1502(-)